VDPTANLKAQLKLANRILRAVDSNNEIDTYDCSELAELVLALDEWIVGGGFLPERWEGDEEEDEDE
jgi:hypothetical protein